MWELSIIGMSHVVFGLILISSKQKECSDRVLICWLLILSLPFLQQILLHYRESWPTFSRIFNQSFTLLHGPLLYLYLKELTSREGEQIRYWPHMIIFHISM